MEREDIGRKIRELIAEVPDYPKPGVSFKDLTGLFASYKVFSDSMEFLANYIKEEVGIPDFVAGIESRGFIIGTALAEKMGVGFVPIRKKGKLPGEVFSQEYDLEYGRTSIEIQKRAMPEGSKVVIADDILATGGTANAAIKLVEMQGGNPVGIAVLASLGYLDGKKSLNKPVFDIIEY